MLSVNGGNDLRAGVEADDQDAISAADRLIRPRLIAFGRHRGLSSEEAEDVAQDTLLAVYRQLKRRDFKGTGSLQAWIYGIFDHRLIDALRKRYRERKALVPLADVEEPGSFDDSNRRQWVRQAVLQLPIRERLVLLLNLQDGVPAREVAPMLGLGVKATEATLTRAKKHFRELLAGGEENRPAQRLKERVSS